MIRINLTRFQLGFDSWNPAIYRVFYSTDGAEFLPMTVGSNICVPQKAFMTLRESIREAIELRKKTKNTNIQQSSEDLPGMYTKSSIVLSWSHLNPWEFPSSRLTWISASCLTWRDECYCLWRLLRKTCIVFQLLKGLAGWLDTLNKMGQSSFTRNQTKIKEQHETIFLVYTSNYWPFLFLVWNEGNDESQFCIQVHSLSYS